MSRSRRNRRNKQKQQSNIDESEHQPTDTELGYETKKVHQVSVQCIPSFNKEQDVVYFDIHIKPEFLRHAFGRTRNSIALVDLERLGKKPSEVAAELAQQTMIFLERYIGKMSDKVKEDKAKIIEKYSIKKLQRRVPEGE